MGRGRACGRIEESCRHSRPGPAGNHLVHRLSCHLYRLQLAADSGHQRRSERQSSKQGPSPCNMEGYDHAEWILADYGDFVVHIFSEKARGYYDERLWRRRRAWISRRQRAPVAITSSLCPASVVGTPSPRTPPSEDPPRLGRPVDRRTVRSHAWRRSPRLPWR